MALNTESKTELKNVLNLHLPECGRDDVIDVRDAFEARLTELKDQAKADLLEKLKTQRDELEERLRAEAVAEGLDADDLFGESTVQKQKQKRAPLPPQYRNPDNAHETWSGRGKRPAWFTAQLASGVTDDVMRIAKNEVRPGWLDSPPV